jgi:hypothetical protein
VVAGKSYSVLHRATVGADAWQKLTDLPVQTESIEIEVVDADAMSISPRFYRVVTPQQ